MAEVRFIHPNGSEETVELRTGDSVMMVAVRNGVPGVDGECGGCLDCATCHVYVEEAQFEQLPAPGEDERDVLANVSAVRKPNSRLGCQVKPHGLVDTLVVYVPGPAL